MSGSTGFCGSASERNVCYEIIQKFSSSGMTEMSSEAFPEPLPRSFLIHKYLKTHDHKIRWNQEQSIDERGEICAGLELNMIHLFYAALTVLQGKQDAKNDTFCL